MRQKSLHLLWIGDAAGMPELGIGWFGWCGVGGQALGGGLGCADGKDLDEAGGSGFGRAHGGFMLFAGGGVEVNREAAWDDDGGVVDVIEIARDAEEER